MSMSVEKLTKLPPVETGFIENPDMPVIPFTMKVRDAGCAAPHAHPRGQLIYASSGTMRVICGRDIWIVPSSQAVWVPSYTEHEVYFPGDVVLRNLFIDRAFTGALPDECVVFEVSPLLRELIIKVSYAQEYAPHSRLYRMMLVIIDELAQAKPTDIRLPLAEDMRLKKFQDMLISSPGDDRSLEEMAKTAGASQRTISRLFAKETGLTFYEWRKRLRLQEAVRRLSEGDDVTCIAFDLGYKSLSAFIKMFRQTMGSPPGRFSKQ